MLVDLGVISGPVSMRFPGSTCLKKRLFLGLFPDHFLSLSDLNFQRLGLRNRRFRMEGVAKVDFS